MTGNGYNQKTDIWGLGVLCYELIFGTVPFKLNSPHDMMKIVILIDKLDERWDSFPWIRSRYLPGAGGNGEEDAEKKLWGKAKYKWNIRSSHHQ